MSEQRLSDERLAELAADCWVGEGMTMASELQSRRAADAAKDAEIKRLLKLIFEMYRVAGPIEGGDELEAVKRLREANRELVEALDTLSCVVSLTPLQKDRDHSSLQETYNKARELIAKHGGGL